MSRTNALRAVVAVTAGLAAGQLFAGAAHADDFNYVGGLRAAGVWIHKDWEPMTVKQGHRLCEKLRAGVSPDDVAAEFGQLPPEVYLPILRDNLCPDAPG